MDKNDEILSRLVSIEATNEEIYKELIRLQKDLKIKRFEEFQLKTLIEDIYDYIKVIRSEKNLSKKVETKTEM